MNLGQIKIGSVVLILLLLMGGCKETGNELETGTTFPESFQSMWVYESLEGTEYESGYYFDETKAYTWNKSGFDPEIGNCYFFDLYVRLSEFKSDLYTVEWKDVNGDFIEYIIEISVDESGNTLIMDALNSGTITIKKIDSTLNEFEPKCDLDFNEIPEAE